MISCSFGVLAVALEADEGAKLRVMGESYFIVTHDWRFLVYLDDLLDVFEVIRHLWVGKLCYTIGIHGATAK